MAGAKVPAPLDPMGTAASWTNILARLEKTYKGCDGISLTNWSSASTDRPQIAAGSVIEIDGAPFEYATDDTIADEAGLTDGWCYVKHVVSGDTVTATLTNTFGTWDTAKQGFYDGSGNRFSLYRMYRSGAIVKIFTNKQEKTNTQIKGFDIVYRNNSTSTSSTIYSELSPYIINVGDFLPISGTFLQGATTYILSIARRSSSTEITLNGPTGAGGFGVISLSSGGTLSGIWNYWFLVLNMWGGA